MNTLLYLLYGNRQEYHLELTYSLGSALRFVERDAQGFQVALLCDEANQRPDLPVVNVVVPREELARWQLGGRYNHAAQAYSVHFGSQHFDGPVVLVDTDTIFRADPRLLFERIRPGQALMHVREGSLGEDSLRAEWVRLIERTGGTIGGYDLSLDRSMFNAGVIGIDPADRPLLDDVKRVMVDVLDNCSAFTAVQVAASLVLDQRIRLNTCGDVIDHYWYAPRAYYHHQFRQLLPQRTAEAFDHLRSNFPPVRNLPPRSLTERLGGKLFELMRSRRGDYAHAYRLSRLARSERGDPELANLWATVAAETLSRVPQPWPRQVRSDFAGFTPEALQGAAWATGTTRSKWQACWERLSG